MFNVGVKHCQALKLHYASDYPAQDLSDSVTQEKPTHPLQRDSRRLRRLATQRKQALVSHRQAEPQSPSESPLYTRRLHAICAAHYAASTRLNVSAL